MTVLEIFAAPRLSARWARFYASVFASVEVLDVDARSAELGARLARDMARRGFTLHNSDAAIAGCAARAGAGLLVTADADFTELRGVRVEYVQPS
jgi:predicted nucleic acid-binding protein